MSNPFTLRIVQDEDFCNRKKEIDDLLRYARSGNNIILFPPQIWQVFIDKTSL